MTGSEELVLKIARDIPELYGMYEEHIADHYSEILPHVFIADVSEHIAAQIRSKGQLPPFVEKMLIILEQGLASEEYSVKDVIGASFVESIEEYSDVCELIKDRCGPLLLREFMTQ